MVLTVLKCFKLKLYRCICWLIVEVMLIVCLINLTERDYPYSEDMEFDFQLISPIFKNKAVQEESCATCGYVIF